MAETGFKKWIITITVITASLLELIDTTIVNVSLPQIQGNLGATLEDVAWVVTGYAVANVIILPMSGWLGSYFGRKNYFLGSIILFTIASFLCGNAHSLSELVMFRILQGIAGGGLISTAQAILVETWPREQIGTATALFGLGAVVGPTVGPTIGGFITDHYTWQWIFYVNIPVGAVAAFCAYTFINKTPKEGRGNPIDWWGIALLAIAVGSLQVILEKGESEDWFAKPYILVLTISAILGTLCFIWRELSTDHPIVNFSIMRHRSFAVGMFTSFILGFGLYGSVFVFPVFCQNLLGFTAQQTGELLFPGGLCTIVMMPFIGKMLNRGIPAQFMATIGSEMGQGTGLNNMMRQLGGSFGIAALTTIIHIRQAKHRSDLLSNINPYNNAFNQRLNMMEQAFMAKGKSMLDATHMAYQAIDGAVTRQALLLTYNDAYLLSGLIMLFSIPLLYLQPFKKGKVTMPTDAH